MTKPHHQLVNKHLFNDSLTQYGDGVFETMLAAGNTIHHWDYHWRRLENSCQRLQIALPEHDLLCQQLQSALSDQGNHFSVVKMLVGRGAGLRGYRSFTEQPCAVQFRLSPHQFNTALSQGLNVRVCQTRLAHQPLLAGLKHCNRLEYIMARREAADTQFDEGLLLDYDNQIIEGLISNIFMLQGRKITTPRLNRAGVCGTMRAFLLDALPQHGYCVQQTELTLADLNAADGIFLTNATAGVMPVISVQGVNKRFDTNIVQPIRQLTEHPSL